MNLLSNTQVNQCERIEQSLLRLLKQVRQLRGEIAQAGKDKGVLGSRGLTEFVVDLLNSRRFTNVDVPNPLKLAALASEQIAEVASVKQLLVAAERAGYSIPTTRAMSKRLTTRAYNVGDIAWSKSPEGWYWKGSTN